MKKVELNLYIYVNVLHHASTNLLDRYEDVIYTNIQWDPLTC